MRQNLADEHIQQTPFGRFVNPMEEIVEETDNFIEDGINSYEPSVSENAD